MKKAVALFCAIVLALSLIGCKKWLDEVRRGSDVDDYMKAYSDASEKLKARMAKVNIATPDGAKEFRGAIIEYLDSLGKSKTNQEDLKEVNDNMLKYGKEAIENLDIMLQAETESTDPEKVQEATTNFQQALDKLEKEERKLFDIARKYGWVSK